MNTHHQAKVWIYFIGLGVLTFLMIHDGITPYAKSHHHHHTDYLGDHFVTDFLWNNLTKTQQFGLSLLITCSIIIPWSKWIIHQRQRQEEDEQLQLSYSLHHLIIAMISFSGYILRRWSKITLQRFFTYQISIPDSIITDGPYQILVHPGYSGLLIHFLGVLLLFTSSSSCLSSPRNNDKGNRKKGTRIFTISFVVVVYSCILAVLFKRMDDEERMLHDHFGERWISHVNDRFRLFPFLY